MQGQSLLDIICRLHVLAHTSSPLNNLGLSHHVPTDAGDIDNARALFERTLAEPELGSSGELWRAYAAFEYEQGDLSAALQVWLCVIVRTLLFSVMRYEKISNLILKTESAHTHTRAQHRWRAACAKPWHLQH